MLQFDKHTKIAFNPQSVASIGQALAQYRQRLADLAVTREQHFDIEFVAQTADGHRRLCLDDVTAPAQLALLKEALALHPDGDANVVEGAIQEGDPVYISEPIFFALALQHPALLANIVATADALVAFSRHHNDTWALWLDDMNVFGVEALYMLARTDSQYAVLLAQFLIPNWDDEHAGACQNYLAALLAHYGWQRDIIKAYLWCDNNAFRYQMFSGDEHQQQSLAEHLTLAPQDYAWFKAALTERLLTEPKMLTYQDEAPEDATPVHDFYATLFSDHDYWWDDELDSDTFWAQPFMGNTLEDEAADLLAAIEAKAQAPLAAHSPSNIQKQQDQDFHQAPGSALLEIHQLIQALPGGGMLWQYIIDGGHSQTVVALNTTALYAFCQTNAPLFGRRIADELVFGKSNQDINEQLVFLLSDLQDELLEDEEDTGQQGALLPNSGLSERQQQWLRLLDVFYRLLGVDELNEHIRDDVVVSWSLMSLDDFAKRYSKAPFDTAAHGQKLLGKLLITASTDCTFHQRQQQSFRDFFSEYRSLANPEQWPLPRFELGHYNLMAWLLFEDWQQQRGDSVTEALARQLAQGEIWQLASQMLLSEDAIATAGDSDAYPGLTHAERALLSQYFCSDAPQLSFKEALALLKTNLLRDDVCRQARLYFPKYSEYQPCYEVFGRFSGEHLPLVLSSYWLQQLPLPLSIQAKRLWQMLVALAPVRMLRTVAQTFSTDSYSVEFDEPLAAIECFDAIEKAGVDPAYRLAYEVQLYQRNGQYQDYIEALDNYADIDSTGSGMFATIARNKAIALQQGLKYISEHNKLGFYRALSLRHPRFTLASDDSLKHDFHVALTRMLRLSILSWEEALAADLGKTVRLMDTDKLSQKPLKFSANLRVDPRLHLDYGQWLEVALVQDKGEYLEVFGLSQYHPGQERLLSHRVLLIDAKQDQETLWQGAEPLFDDQQRLEIALEKTLAYLHGHLSYQEAAAHYQHRVATDLAVSPVDHYLAGLGDFIWLLEDEMRDRLLQLLLNHSYRSFKLFEQRLMEGYLRQRLTDGSIDMATFLEHDWDRHDDTYMEAALGQFLPWLGALAIKTEHQLLFCIEHCTYQACQQYLLTLLSAQNMAKQTARLSAKSKVQLIQMLRAVPGGNALIAALSHDAARKVRDAAAACLQD
ncbi:hypothetical protein [Gallaecimonas mangrovi]|uniref:hypothetical protein n=1 Tax=Gallaecimonas mangrovi TaxID=2291597 RepID=UPI000E20B740|nr:hypothetical protein [Gallaecimonas mangrovi]